ncbi:protocadherin Fat 2-like [Homarus americanus]|uniref:protocadherin Fat 2-like n=1 Tax=Homarus americanus TaxID=6706 RepID=UPI001C44C06B|nr:protocadherin Fat 2-like [Homarus americanus]
MSSSPTEVTVRYTITEGNRDGIFTIHHRSGVITLAGSLDYELQDKHQLVVSAESADVSARTLVLVNVLDTNDHAPFFLDPAPKVTVIEEDDRDLPAPIIKVEAVDEDKVDEGRLVYSVGGDGVDNLHPDDTFFRIHPRTGQLYQLRPLDRDPPDGLSVWKVKVQVRDGQVISGHQDDPRSDPEAFNHQVSQFDLGFESLSHQYIMNDQGMMSHQDKESLSHQIQDQKHQDHMSVSHQTGGMSHLHQQPLSHQVQKKSHQDLRILSHQVQEKSHQAERLLSHHSPMSHQADENKYRNQKITDKNGETDTDDKGEKREIERQLTGTKLFTQLVTHTRLVPKKLPIRLQVKTVPQQVITVPQQVITVPQQVITVPQQMPTVPQQMPTVPQQMPWYHNR